MWVIFVLILIFCIIVAVISIKEEKEFFTSTKNSIRKYLDENNIVSNYVAQVTSENSTSKNPYIIKYVVDEQQEKLVIFQAHKNVSNIPTTTCLSFDEVIGIKIYKDDAVVGGIGRAILGDFVAGGVGAIVGATTAKKHTTSYKIDIFTNNIASPAITIDLIDKKLSTLSEEYKKIDKFAQKVYASIQSILNKIGK